jgi:hypothetical protein
MGTHGHVVEEIWDEGEDVGAKRTLPEPMTAEDTWYSALSLFHHSGFISFRAKSCLTFTPLLTTNVDILPVRVHALMCITVECTWGHPNGACTHGGI